MTETGGVRYRTVSWRPPVNGDGLKQRLRDANARVLVYKPLGYRLLCSTKVAEGLLKRVQVGTANDRTEQGSMDWKGYKKIADEILIGNESTKEYRYLPYLPLWWPEIDKETGKEKIAVAEKKDDDEEEEELDEL